MTPYIKNLTDHLIGEHDFDESWDDWGHYRQGEFRKYLWRALLPGPVKKMTPETLGKVMCSLRTHDTGLSRRELFENGTLFGGSEGDMLREMVTYCLVHIIFRRLSPDFSSRVIARGPHGIPELYKRKKVKKVTS